VPEELWTEVHDIVQETGIKTIPKKKKCKKAKWLSEEALHIAGKRREVKSKGEKERYIHLNAEFQRIARRDKKAFLDHPCLKYFFVVSNFLEDISSPSDVLFSYISLPTKVHLVKAMVFPVVMYGCEHLTIKKGERWIIDAFEPWCWRRLLRVPYTARRSNQFILKESIPEYSLEGLMFKLKLQYFGHFMQRADLFEKTLSWNDWRQ